MSSTKKLKVVDNPHVIRCAKCGKDIRKKDCGCDAGWKVGEKA